MPRVPQGNNAAPALQRVPKQVLLYGHSLIHAPISLRFITITIETHGAVFRRPISFLGVF